MPPITLEVCTASPADALAAQAGGADRVELNRALELGGLTPSIGSLEATVQAVDVPVIAMIRPRPAGFCYSTGEFSTLVSDLEAALERGVAGIAFGVLTRDGSVDIGRCRTIVKRCGSSDAVFHRAFDVTPDPAAALEQLIDLGVDRVLTSGQHPTALAGADLITRLREQAGNRIEILPGAGITGHNAADLLRRTGCTQIHGSFRTRIEAPSTARQPDFGFGTAYGKTDATAVRAARTAIDAL